MADYRSEDLYAEAEAEQAANEAEIASKPATDAGFDAVSMASHFDAALTASQSRVNGVYNDGAAPADSGDTDPSRDGTHRWGY